MRLLLHEVADGQAIPDFLGASDHPWLRRLLDDVDRLAGHTHRDLQAYWRDGHDGAPRGKRALARHVLERLLGGKTAAAVSPVRARSVLFAAASAGPVRARAELLVAAARELAIETAELEAALFADLPGERRVVPPSRPLSPSELALRCNLALAQGFLLRASSVSLTVEGNARPIVRHAKLRGLLCTVSRRATDGAVLELSGPLSLFHHTLVYGRALAGLIPHLAWCPRFRLDARCRLADQDLRFRLDPRDPIFPADEPPRFDSRLEARFARDIGRLTTAWNVIREPEPVALGGGQLAFPDFALVHREDPSRRWLVELVGFWTADYLARKLAQYRAAALPNLILCVDEQRACRDEELPAAAQVLRFRRKVDAAQVLAILDAPPSRPSSTLVGPWQAS